MKIKIGDADADAKVSGGVSMRYRAGKTYLNVPTAIGKSLIEAGKAEELADKSKKPSEGDQ